MRRNGPSGSGRLGGHAAAVAVVVILFAIPGCAGNRLRGLAWWPGKSAAPAVDPFESVAAADAFAADSLADASAEALPAVPTTKTEPADDLADLVASVDARRADRVAATPAPAAPAADAGFIATVAATASSAAAGRDNPFASYETVAAGAAPSSVAVTPAAPTAADPVVEAAGPAAPSTRDGRWSHDDFVAALTATAPTAENIPAATPPAVPTPAAPTTPYDPFAAIPPVTTAALPSPHDAETARTRQTAEFGAFAIVPAEKERHVPEGEFFPIVAAVAANPAPRGAITPTSLVVEPAQRWDGDRSEPAAPGDPWTPLAPLAAAPVIAAGPEIATARPAQPTLGPSLPVITPERSPAKPIIDASAPPALGPPRPAVADIDRTAPSDPVATTPAPAITLDDVDFTLGEPAVAESTEEGRDFARPAALGVMLGTAVAGCLWLLRRRA